MIEGSAQSPPNLVELREKILSKYGFVLDACQKFMHVAGRIDDAEEIANEVIYEAYKNANQFKGGNLDGWLYIISRNTANDFLDKAKREPSDPLRQKEISTEYQQGQLEVFDQNPNPEENMIREEEEKRRERRYQEAFNKLSETEKEILKLDLDGLKTKEIALKLGIPIGTAGVYLLRARQKLAKLLGKPDFNWNRSRKI